MAQERIIIKGNKGSIYFEKDAADDNTYEISKELTLNSSNDGLDFDGSALAATGDKGEQGVKGVQGVQGAEGAQGAQGAEGVKGVQGVAGSDGDDGSDGAQGVKGVQGVQGAQGTQGTQGVQGVKGVQGVQGTQGTQGVKGATGAGSDGDDGADGDKGQKGLGGTDGSDATIGDFTASGSLLAAGSAADARIRSSAGAGGTVDVILQTSTGDFKVDAANDISLDAGGGDIVLRDDGSIFGSISNSSGGLVLSSGTTPTPVQAYDSSGDFTGGRIINVYPMGISGLSAGSTTHFSWTSTNSNSGSINNHRMVAPYGGKIVLATFVCDDGISDSIASAGYAGAVFSIGKTTAMTTSTSSWTTHTDTAGVWADSMSFPPPGGANPDFGRAGPVEDWAGFSWDAGDVIEAKLVPSSNSGASSDRGTMSMVIQWDA